MKAVFVYSVRDIALGVVLALALGLMFYAWVEFKVKEWRKAHRKRLEQRFNKGSEPEGK